MTQTIICCIKTIMNLSAKLSVLFTWSFCALNKCYTFIWDLTRVFLYFRSLDSASLSLSPVWAARGVFGGGRRAAQTEKGAKFNWTRISVRSICRLRIKDLEYRSTCMCLEENRIDKARISIKTKQLSSALSHIPMIYTVFHESIRCP